MRSGIFARFLRAAHPGERTSGRPTSSNAASSFHLFWDVPPVPLRSVSITLRVQEPPVVPELYFWALQASFLDGQRRTGAAHLGLQHHPQYPGSAAANWGGYHESGGELSGRPLLPSSLGNPNTCDYPWQPARDYRLLIEPSPESGWRGSITPLDTGVPVVIRDLQGGGDTLGAPMVWSEVFAPCDAAPAAVLWSDPQVQTTAGETLAVTSARVNYQTVEAGGCSNTSTDVQGHGVLQRTGTPRNTAGGSVARFGTSHFRNT